MSIPSCDFWKGVFCRSKVELWCRWGTIVFYTLMLVGVVFYIIFASITTFKVGRQQKYRWKELWSGKSFRIHTLIFMHIRFRFLRSQLDVWWWKCKWNFLVLNSKRLVKRYHSIVSGHAVMHFGTGGTESWFFPVYCLFCLKKSAVSRNPDVFLQGT